MKKTTNNGTDQGLLLSDLHVGSMYGLWPPGMQTDDPRTGEVIPLPQTKVNEAIYAHWEKMLAVCKQTPPKFVLFNGDLIEGNQRKENGKGLLTGQMSLQVKACIKVIQTLRDILPGVPFYFTAGTDYHQMPDGENADIYIARHFNAQYGDEMIVEECGIRMFCRHTISSSMSSWQYMATAPGRDHMLLFLNNGQDKYGDIDVAIFSHRHQFVSVQFTSGFALVTPCWQSKTSYAVKKGLTGVPDIGWVMLHIDHAKKIAVDTSGIATIVRPCKVVGSAVKEAE